MFDAKQHKAGFCTAILLVALTVVTFASAICTPPISGPFSTVPKTIYPYTDTISRFPRDYYWMYPAMLLMLVYIFFISVIDRYVSESKKIYSHAALLLSGMSAGILIINYFIQVSVVYPSLKNGEFDGFALLSQYNPHGLFIAAEEIGYILMALSISLLAPLFKDQTRIHKAIRITATLCFIVTLISFGLITMRYGMMREYYFECAIIAIDFISLIFIGIFTAILFRHGGKAEHERKE